MVTSCYGQRLYVRDLNAECFYGQNTYVRGLNPDVSKGPRCLTIKATRMG